MDGLDGGAVTGVGDPVVETCGSEGFGYVVSGVGVGFDEVAFADAAAVDEGVGGFAEEELGGAVHGEAKELFLKVDG